MLLLDLSVCCHSVLRRCKLSILAIALPIGIVSPILAHSSDLKSKVQGGIAAFLHRLRPKTQGKYDENGPCSLTCGYIWLL
jgi:hypothetical protein